MYEDYYAQIAICLLEIETVSNIVKEAEIILNDTENF